VDPDWLGSPQHFVAGALLAVAVVILAPRFSITSEWVAAALAVGIVMIGEALVELAEYPLRYSDNPNLTAYLDTLADLASSLVGGVVGAGAATAYRLSTGRGREASSPRGGG
jgi:NAD/NADP transhydrogenase beta subunit